MVSEPLAFVLRSGREALNAQFAAARRLYPDLDGESVRRFLETTVDPLAQAAAAVAPDRVPEVVMAAYELGLELVGKRLVGGSARHDLIERGWQTIGATAAPILAASPRVVLAAISNAIVQLTTTPGARAETWIRELAALAPRCPDPATLLAVGQVRAWLAGLAHYRAGALAVCDRLPGPLALAAVGASGSWPAVRARLGRDPWYVPGQTDGPPAVRAVGAFRGLGGLFTTPPRIAVRAGHFLVTSGQGADEAWWVLAADAFGATFHPAYPDERAASFDTALPAGVQVKEGQVRIGRRNVAVPVVGGLTSAASDGTTLAVTSSLTHAITLVALTADPP